MISPTQSPRDRILWILANSGGKMERSRLRRRAGMKLADLNLVLGELTREGRIRISGDEVHFKFAKREIIDVRKLNP